MAPATYVEACVFVCVFHYVALLADVVQRGRSSLSSVMLLAVVCLCASRCVYPHLQYVCIPSTVYGCMCIHGWKDALKHTRVLEGWRMRSRDDSVKFDFHATHRDSFQSIVVRVGKKQIAIHHCVERALHFCPSNPLTQQVFPLCPSHPKTTINSN